MLNPGRDSEDAKTDLEPCFRKHGLPLTSI
jgi:hypothetical protein